MHQVAVSRPLSIALCCIVVCFFLELPYGNLLIAQARQPRELRCLPSEIALPILSHLLRLCVSCPHHGGHTDCFHCTPHFELVAEPVPEIVPLVSLRLRLAVARLPEQLPFGGL